MRATTVRDAASGGDARQQAGGWISMTDTRGYVAAHIAHLQRKNLRPSTIYQRERVIARLARDYPDWLHATTAEIVASLASRNLGPSSLRTEIMHLTDLFRWLQREGVITEDPTVDLERPKVPRRLPRPMSDVDKDRALAGAGLPVRPMLFLAAYAGLRACEIAGLRAEHLNWQDRLIHIEEAKGGQNASLPMSGILSSALARCELPTVGWVFPNATTGEPLKPWSVSQKCNKYLHSIGIGDTFHSLRHWFGTSTYRASGRDLRLTQELMRHASPTTTAGYTFVDPGESARVVDLLPA